MNAGNFVRMNIYIAETLVGSLRMYYPIAIEPPVLSTDQKILKMFEAMDKHPEDFNFTKVEIMEMLQ